MIRIVEKRLEARAGDGPGDHKRPFGRAGRRARRRRALREVGGARRVPRRPLQAQARHHRRRDNPRDPQAQGGEVHDGHHRALPQARGVRRGGHDRDVPGRRLHQAHRGRERDPLGRERVGRDRLQPQREGVQERRGVALEEAHAGVPVRVHRRDLPQAQLGRGLRERGRDGGHRRRRGRAPRDHRVRRGLHGVVGLLARLPVVAQVARAARRADVHRGQGRGHGGVDRGGLPGGRVPALHGALRGASSWARC